MACMMVCLDLYTIDAWLALATQRKVMHKSCYRRAWRQYQALPEAQRRPLEDAIMAPWTAHTVPAPAPVRILARPPMPRRTAAGQAMAMIAGSAAAMVPADRIASGTPIAAPGPIRSIPGPNVSWACMAASAATACTTGSSRSGPAPERP